MNITIGCDPEFILYNTGGMLSPIEAFTTSAREKHRDSIWDVANDDYNRDINPHIFPFHFEEGGIEFNPEPAKTPKEGVDNLHDALEKLRPMLRRGVKIGAVSANSFGKYNGGHIHIGGDISVWYKDKLKPFCDTITLLYVLEDVNQGRLRRETWGQPYSTRSPEEHVPTWEIRFPSPDWATKPELAELTYKFVIESVEKYAKLPPPPCNAMYDYGFVSSKLPSIRERAVNSWGVDSRLIDALEEYGKKLKEERKKSNAGIVEVTI